jgi:hypothetical protein
MSERRQVWATLGSLLHRLDTSPDRPLTVENISSLEQEVRKLGKTQFKANALADEQANRLEQALAAARLAQEQNAELIGQLEHLQGSTARRELLEAILPALDGVENAIASGDAYLKKRDIAARKTNLTPAQAILVSPADRAMLSGWLDGLRLVRERLLAILAAGDVTRIPTVGELFDPYRHVAVGKTEHPPAGAPAVAGVIVAEERAGYQSPTGVIRYAEVVVYRP